MRVAHADDVGLDAVQPAGPELGVGRSVLVERVARRGVDEEEVVAVDFQVQRERQAGQVCPLLRPEQFPHQRPGRSRQKGVADLAAPWNILSNRVIVIAADYVFGILTHPLDARAWFGAIIDQVA